MGSTNLMVRSQKPAVTAQTSQGSRWLRLIDTAVDSPGDFVDPTDAQPVLAGFGYRVEPMALVVLQSADLAV